MSPPQAAIYGVAGTELSSWERGFLAEARPLGLILFRRNVADAAQVRRLTDAFRDLAGHPGAWVLVDEEGGRVQRLAPELCPRLPAARAYGQLWEAEPARAEALARRHAEVLAAALGPLGIDSPCLPVLDLGLPETHEAIGDRAYGASPVAVAALGRAVCEGLLAAGRLPIVKHMPGHGRARVDSHDALPRVEASAEELRQTDFAAFRALADMPLGMTGHLVFDAYDTERASTLSPAVVAQAIRGEIGFDGALMTDDLSMGALSGPMAARCRAALEAGCDLLLHCNGERAEMEAVAGAAPALAGPALRRVEAAEALRRAGQAALGQPIELAEALWRDLGAGHA